MKKFEKFMSDKDRMLKQVKEESQKDIAVRFINEFFQVTYVSYFSNEFTSSVSHVFSPFSSFIYRFIHSIIHSFIHSLIHSFTHSFTYSFCHSFIHSFTRSLIHSFIYPFIHRKFETLFKILSHGCLRSFGVTETLGAPRNPVRLQSILTVPYK